MTERVLWSLPAERVGKNPAQIELKDLNVTTGTQPVMIEIEADNVPADMAVKLRVPGCVRKPKLDEDRNGPKVHVAFRGELGHRIEPCHPGVILTYGPLVLVPGSGLPGPVSQTATKPDGAPPGYIPQSLPPGVPAIKLNGPPDADGFVQLPLCPPSRPLPVWSYFDEGPGAAHLGGGVGGGSRDEVPRRSRACGTFYADVLQHFESQLFRYAGSIP